jgi:hypothetical protein
MEDAMKNLVLAAGIVFLAAICLFGLLILAGIERAGAMSVATMPLGGIVYVHQTLDKRDMKPNLRALPRGVVTLEGFALPWYQMLVYGALMFAALKQIGGFIGGVTAGLAGVESDNALTVIATVVGNLVAIIGVYAICFWIGTRCDKYPYLVGLGVPIFGHMIGITVDYLILSSAEFTAFFGQPKSLGFFIVGVISGTLVVVLFALLGIWRGSRARLSAYLSYLLGSLPPDTRNTIIDLTYEEVKGLSADIKNRKIGAEPMQP